MFVIQVFCGKSLRDSNSAWTIKCLQSPEFLPYESIIYLQHNNTNNFLEICTDRHNLSPVSKHTEGKQLNFIFLKLNI